MKNTRYEAYANATQTVAKTRQVIMLYDAAIRNLRQAKKAIEEKRIEDRYKLLCKVGDIIYGLQGALDFESGGEVAKVLYNYYASLDMRVFSLHSSQDFVTCDKVIEDLRAMREVWEEIDRSAAGEPASDVKQPETDVISFPPETDSIGIVISA